MEELKFVEFTKKYLARFKHYYKKCDNQRQRNELKRSVFDNNNLSSKQKKEFWEKVII